MNKKHSIKTTFFLLGVLLLGLLVSGCVGGQATAQVAEEGETLTAVRGDLVATMGATGKLVVPQTAVLGLSNGGMIQQVHVAVGNYVAEGDALVVVDKLTLERAVLQAEQDLRSQQANLASLQTPPTAAALLSAEAAVESAQARLEQLQASPTTAEIDTAEANLRAAEANVWAASNRVQAARNSATAGDIQSAQQSLAAAQQSFNQARDTYVQAADCKVAAGETTHTCTLDLSKEGMPSIQYELTAAQARLDEAKANVERLQNGDANGIRMEQAGVASAVAQRDAAQARLELTKVGASAADIAGAAAEVAQGQSSLATLLAGSKAEEIVIAEAQVAQAELTLRQAQHDLAQADLVAPFAGVVTAVSVHPGEQASGSMVTLAKLAPNGDGMVLQLNVNELDLAQLSLGQATTVALESWPNEPLTGEVVLIEPQSQAQTANEPVRYGVQVKLDEGTRPLRIGMSGFANLVLSERKDVLLLPGYAVTTNQETGQSFVNMVQGSGENETVSEVEVVTGATNGQLVEIVSGISEGDQVRIIIAPPPTEDIFGEDEGF
ncbi:MAG: efflux RND transporter periplasmic adaptor subunit [Chloroflexota bacterium]